jgi:transcription termination factor Rho
MSPSQIRRFSLRTGDTVEGQIRAPEGRRALFRPDSRSTPINFEDPEKVRHKVHFDNLTPLYPDERLKMESTIRPSRIAPAASSTSSRRSARASAR